MPAATHGWLTAGTESLLNYQGCFCHHCCWHKSQALTRASTLQQAKEVWSSYQPINHSFTTSLANSSHCQTKWFLVLLDAVCVHNLFTHGCGSEICFLILHHCGFAHCCFLMQPKQPPQNLNSLSHFVSGILMISHQMWHRIRNPVGPTRFPLGWTALCHWNRTGKYKAQKCMEVWRNLC